MLRKLLTLLALLPSTALAFCGFYVGGASSKLYNNATQVVIMRDGNRTVLSMQNNYQGPPENFAMVVPVPVVLQKENVKTLTKEVFSALDLLDAPRLVEYWEQDPCSPVMEQGFGLGLRGTGIGGGGTGEGTLGMANAVKIEAQFSVGEYDILILSATESNALETWLKENKYNIPDGAAAVLQPYITSGQKFFVAKVDIKRVTFNAEGQAMLSPLRFHYDDEKFALPIRLGMLNAKDKQDLIVHILAKDRYEVTNYKNVFIPTNLDVAESVKDNFGSFYAALFDATLEKFKDADGRNPVVTEYAWMAGSCDPCPGPTLQQEDALSLGGDVLPSYKRDPWGLSQMTLTRLHARYDQSSLGEDLIFQKAKPAEGGREYPSYPVEGKIDRNGAVTQGVYSNNFQGRFIVRHSWKGDIKCANPQRGIWGGPIGDPWGMNQPTAARDLAFAKRDGVALASLLRQDLPSLGITQVGGPSSAEPKKPIEKKKFEAPAVAPVQLPSIKKPEDAWSFSWGFWIALSGGVLLLLLVLSSRKKD